jgi:predicted GNAT family N-acyltransferase
MQFELVGVTTNSYGSKVDRQGQATGFMSINIKRLENEQELHAARTLRTQVFVVEQGVSQELEIDALDALAVHAIACQDGKVVGTGRLVINNNAEARIGRMAVNKSLRRRGVGTKVLEFLEREARVVGTKQILLHAQCRAKEFYTKHGYLERGDVFMEGGIEHIEMVKTIG